MKILFVNHFRPTTASFLRQLGLAKELSREGHEISFIVRRPSKGKLDSKQSEMALQGGSSVAETISYWSEPFEQLLPYNALRLQEKCKRFDLIHVNRASPFTSTMLSFSKIMGKRIVLDWEDWDGIGGYISVARKSLPSRFALGFFEEVVPKSCNSIIVVSRFLGQRAERQGIARDKIFYIPNGFDESLFNESVSGARVRQEYKLGSKPLILFLSALHSYEAENWSKILDCLQYVVKEIPDATLLMTGHGDPSMIMQYAETRGIRKNVSYIGYVPRALIPEVMATADLAVHILSDNVLYRSASPMVVPEYMAMGKAIIASDVGELSTMLKNGAGVLIKDQTAKAFGEAAVKLLVDSNARKKFGETASTRARAEYSYRVLAKKAETAYARALEA